MISKADIYRAAMRLLEQHGDAAEIAAMLRADPFIQSDDHLRGLVIAAIAELRGKGKRPH